ncbi:MAG: hypothetical protein A2542_03775 [Parcubacteria group bacterium RIFOXYD2_FULL_52_8]|nr:MAG: hypothetical protein A2542_03775 [Parcubacteria group bacterium RIFOXYD2_FULL_52_8]
MPTLYIMCGLPFSGKTYLARELAKHLGIETFSYDELWCTVKAKENRDAPWDELCGVAEDKIRMALSSGKSIIYDTLNDTAGNREKLRRVASEATGKAMLVYSETPMSVILERRQANLSSKQRHDVAEDNFQKAIAHFEPPLPSENATVYRPNEDLSEWLRRFKHT